MRYRRRLMLLVTLILSVVMAGQAVFIGWGDFIRDREARWLQAQVLAADQATLLSEPIRNFERPRVQRILKALERLPDFRQAIIRDPGGRIIARLGTRPQSETLIRVTEPIVIEPTQQRLGELTLVIAGVSMEAAIFNAMKRNFWLLVVTLVVANAGLWWAAILVTRPLDRVRSAALAVANGDLDHPIPLTHRKDELGDLARAVEQLRQGIVNLHALQASLTDQVARQTRDLLVAKDQAQAGVRSRERFLATISNELRTPLTAICGAVGMLGLPDAGQLSPTGRELRSIAARNCDRLSTLINEILDMQALDEGRVKLQCERLDWARIIIKVVQELDDYAHQQGVRLHVGRMDAPAWIVADPGRLRRAVYHVVHNAIKFSRSGKQVLVELTRDSDHYRLAVSDQGEGIAEEIRSRVFERFSRADETLDRNQGGAGLGLALVRALVERHGGNVSFDTVTVADQGVTAPGVQPQTGTTFYISLPMAPVDVPEADQPLAS